MENKVSIKFLLNFHGKFTKMKRRACEKKWAVCDVNREPFHKCGTFVFWILSLNTLHLNMKIWEKYEKQLYAN